MKRNISFLKSNITTRATPSVRSPVQNLSQDSSELNPERILNAIGSRFLKDNNNSNSQFETVNPDENSFQGVEKLKDDLKGWKWIFAKTPQFKVGF